MPSMKCPIFWTFANPAHLFVRGGAFTPYVKVGICFKPIRCQNIEASAEGKTSDSALKYCVTRKKRHQITFTGTNNTMAWSLRHLLQLVEAAPGHFINLNLSFFLGLRNNHATSVNLRSEYYDTKICGLWVSACVLAFVLDRHLCGKYII